MRATALHRPLGSPASYAYNGKHHGLLHYNIRGLYVDNAAHCPRLHLHQLLGDCRLRNDDRRGDVLAAADSIWFAGALSIGILLRFRQTAA